MSLQSIVRTWSVLLFIALSIPARAQDADLSTRHVRLVMGEPKVPIDEMVRAVTGASEVRVSLDPAGALASLPVATDADVKALQEAAHQEGEMSPQDKAERWREIEQRLEELYRDRIFVEMITAPVKAGSSDPAARRPRASRQELQTLEMSLAAKEARRVAIARAMDQRRKDRTAQIQADAVLEKLRTIVDHRRLEVETIQEMHRDRREAELKLLQAELDVAEREQQLRSDDELLERLYAELQMLVVDIAELSAQIDYVRRHEPLAAIDLQELTPQDVDKLQQQYAIGLGSEHTLLRHYANQRKELLVEAFSLLVDAVEPHNPDPR